MLCSTTHTAAEFKKTCADYIKAVFSMPGAITDQEVGPQAAKEQVSLVKQLSLGCLPPGRMAAAPPRRRAAARESMAAMWSCPPGKQKHPACPCSVLPCRAVCMCRVFTPAMSVAFGMLAGRQEVHALVWWSMSAPAMPAGSCLACPA